MGDKKKWSLVTLNRWSSYTAMIVWGILLSALSIGHLRQVVVLQRGLFEQV